MSKQHEANNTYSHGIEAGFSRKQIIAEIAIEVGVSAGYASTLYNNARKAEGAYAAPTKPTTKPMVKPTTKPKTNSTDVTEFNRQNCRTIDNAINDALKQVEAQFGVTIKIGGGRFSSNEFTTKITVSTGDGTDAAKEKFGLYAFRYNLKNSDFGKTFTSNGEIFRISGIKPRGKKYPIMAERVRDGARYKFSAERIRGLIA